MNIADFFKNLINTLLDGSFERMRVINAMNQSFKEYYYSGEIDRLCKVSISQGDEEFRHEMSSVWFRSGFKITIENDNNLKESEINDISRFILSNNAFIRQLMAMGFDTLIIQGRISRMGKKYSLKAYANLDSYFIE